MLPCVSSAPLTVFAAGSGLGIGLTELNHLKTLDVAEQPLELLPGQNPLLLRDAEWDEALRAKALPIALSKQHVASRFQAVQMPERIRGSFFHLLADASFERHPDAILHRGLFNLHRLLTLGSPAATDNSLYEYLSYQVFAMITTLKQSTLLEDFIAFLAKPYSLVELTEFCRHKKFLDAFDLRGSRFGQTTQLRECLAYLEQLDFPVDALSDLKKGMSALAHLERSRKYSAGLAQDLQDLSPYRIATIAYRCRQDGMRYAWLLEGLKQIRGKPFRTLLLLRLLQTIGHDAFLHKVPELVSFPWADSVPIPLNTYDGHDPRGVAGTLHTAFHVHTELTHGLLTLLSAQRSIHPHTLEQRRKRMDQLIRQKPMTFRKVNKDSIALLLKLQPTATSQALAERILHDDIEVIGLSPNELKELNAKRRHKNPHDTGTLATYRLPQKQGERPALLVPEYGGAYSPNEIAFLAHHEGRHLSQAEVYGSHWIGEHLILAEMEAWSWDMTFRLINGDDSFISRFAALSSISFALGLQNGLEQVYSRHRKLPT